MGDEEHGRGEEGDAPMPDVGFVEPWLQAWPCRASVAQRESVGLGIERSRVLNYRLCHLGFFP